MTSSRTSSTTPVVRVASTSDLVACVPYLLGFVPTRSLVLIGLRPPRLRCGLVARIDLPPDGADVEPLLDLLVPSLLRDDPEQVAVVVYDDQPWVPDARPRQELVDALDAAFAREGVGVKEAAYVGTERFWSFTCRLPDCCPDQGRSLARLGSSVVAATMVVQGRAPLRDRDELVQRVGAPGPLVAAAVAAVALRESRWRDTGSGFGVGAGATVGTPTVELFEALVTRREQGGPPADVEEAGRVLAGLADIHVRDEVALRCCGWLGGLAADGAGEPQPPSPDDPVTQVLLDLATSSDGCWAVPALTLLALQYWNAGEGALANAAVERALDLDPGYRMAALADQLLRGGVPPDWVSLGGQRRDSNETAS